MDQPSMKQIIYGFPSPKYMENGSDKHPYSTDHTKEGFSMQPCKNNSHPSHAFKQHGKSDWHLRLERKTNNAYKERF